LSPKIAIDGRTRAALRRLKTALRDRRRRRNQLAREHELALLERGRQAKRKNAEAR
jgi:hypothetical protein